MKFCVWIVAPPKNPHWQALKEVADGIVHSLNRLGHDAALTVGDVPSPEGRLIVFNSHMLAADYVLPADAILYNAEQLPLSTAGAPLGLVSYVQRLGQHMVWDYSEQNRHRLRNYGHRRIELCPVGYYPELSTLVRKEGAEEAIEPSVDVLFYGSLNARRAAVLADCELRGLKTKHLFGAYGEERDEWVKRAKVVLNMHYYDQPIWEVFRCSFLLANKKCIVSEAGGTDFDLEVLAQSMTVYTPYGELAESCEKVLKSGEYAQIGYKGHDLFSLIHNQHKYVERALKATLALESVGGAV